MKTTLALDLAPLAESIISAEKQKGEAASRFRIAMGESALAMAVREKTLAANLASAEQALLERPEALIAAIRSGVHDADPVLHGQLLALARLRTAITRPSALTAEEQDQIAKA